MTKTWNIGGLLLVLLTLAALPGCGAPAGEIFPRDPAAPQWPGGAQETRIAWVGQLETDHDLKPAVSGMQAVGEALLGKKEARSMLTPFALCTDGGDRLFVADSGAQTVHMFDLKSRLYKRWTPETGGAPKGIVFSQPVGIAWDPAGRVLVADSIGATIFAFDRDGKYLGQLGAGKFLRPCGIAVEPGTRRIFVVDSKMHNISILSPEGALLSTFGRQGNKLGEFNYPTNLAFDSAGRLLVADALNFRIQIFGPDQKVLRAIGQAGDTPGYFGQIKSLALDTEGHIYVVDARWEAVQIFDDEGQFLLDFGEEGKGKGQFWLPTGICIDARNRIWVADSYNRRVQVFDYYPRKQP